MIIGERDSGHGGLGGTQVGEESAADTLRRERVLRVAVRSGRSAGHLRYALLAATYFVLWLLAFQVSTGDWSLPAGLRFLALWLVPSRRWGWFALADIAAILVLDSGAAEFRSWVGFFLATFMPWCGCALVIAGLRSGRVYAAPESPARMGSTLGAMLLAACVNAIVLVSMHVVEHGALEGGWIETGLLRVMGDFVGMMTVVPVGLQLLQKHARGSERRRMLFELALVFLPLLALFALLLPWGTTASLYGSIMALAPMMLMAFRYGWRGASWAVAATSLSFQLVRLRVELPIPPEVLQLFLAIVGSGVLVLGSAIESLRRVNIALIERNRREKDAHARLAQQAEALRDLSRRLVRAREDEQGRLAHELHDELGQSVTALGTRLSLIARKSDDPELLAALHAQRELVQRIQVSIREVLQGLRPAILDRFGLEVALREGPIQRFLADAAVGYDLQISGPIDRVGSDTASAIYRISQEAATNCVRHAHASQFRLRVDVAPTWSGDLEVHLRIEDDGQGFDHAVVQASSLGGGLRGMRDRIMALSGEYSCDSGVGGTRHTIWFVERVASA